MLVAADSDWRVIWLPGQSADWVQLGRSLCEGRVYGWVGEHLHTLRLRKQDTAAAVAVALWQRNQLGPILKTELTRMDEGKEKKNSPGRRQRSVV